MTAHCYICTDDRQFGCNLAVGESTMIVYPTGKFHPRLIRLRWQYGQGLDRAEDDAFHLFGPAQPGAPLT